MAYIPLKKQNPSFSVAETLLDEIKPEDPLKITLILLGLAAASHNQFMSQHFSRFFLDSFEFAQRTKSHW